MDNNKSSSTTGCSDQSEYQTGFTQLPKRRSGLIAFLLVVIILLSSMISVLSMMNVHLFRQLDALSSQSTAPVRFSGDGNRAPSQPEDTTPASDGTSSLPLTPIPGITGYVLSDFEQELYQLPQGFCVTQVDASSNASVNMLFPGDILLRLDGVAIDHAATLNDVLSHRQPGDTVSVLVYRAGEQHSISIKLPE